MRILLRIVSAGIAGVGIAILVPGAVLLNQQLQIMPTADRWGIFDPALGGHEVSNGTAETVCGITGLFLVVLGVGMFRWTRRRRT